MTDDRHAAVDRHGRANRDADGPRDVDPGTAGGRAQAPREIGGPVGPEPTRYGDWERKGRCIDF